jgi:hypothetical protein
MKILHFKFLYPANSDSGTAKNSSVKLLTLPNLTGPAPLGEDL